MVNTIGARSYLTCIIHIFSFTQMRGLELRRYRRCCTIVSCSIATRAKHAQDSRGSDTCTSTCSVTNFWDPSEHNPKVGAQIKVKQLLYY